MSGTLRGFRARLILAVFTPVAVLGFALAIGGSRTALAACTVPSLNYGAVSYTISVPAAGNYRVWSRITAADATNNSYMLEIDGNSCYTIGDAPVSTSAWTWVDYQAGTTTSKITPSLSAGQHSIKIIGREASVKVDRIMALSDQSCVPSGTGDNCAVTSDVTTPTVTITAPADNATVSGKLAITATATDNKSVQKVEFYEGDVLRATQTSSPYAYTLDTTALSNGAHTVIVKAYDEAGNVGSDTARITVKNGDAQAPSAPTDLNVASSDPSKVTISWKASTDNKAVTGYIVRRNGAAIGTTASTTYTDTKMLPGETYAYSVIAYDEAGNSSLASQSVSISIAKPADTQAPSVPTNVSAIAVSASQINISWKASTDNTAVADYDVYRAEIGGNAVRVATVRGTNYGDTGLHENTNYSYYVIAHDANSNASGKSAEAAAKTPATSTPTPSEPSDPTQQTRVGTIRGKVSGKRGRPLSNTQVTVTSAEKRYTATTNSQGVYRIDDVVTGRYDIYYRADGYQRLRDRVRIREAKSTINNIRLYENGRSVRWWNRWW